MLFESCCFTQVLLYLYYRWCGRDHREKISTHVAADEVLDLKPFCAEEVKDGYKFQLFAVVIHHGRGFGSGHYTAYTWNREAGKKWTR